MVYIDKNQLSEVEYLFNQSAQGLHILFDNANIRRVLSQPTEEIDFFSFENVQKIQKILSDFIAKSTIKSKMDFLDNLDQGTYDLLLRTYFNIVENSIYEKGSDKH